MMATQEALAPSASKPLSLLHGTSEPPLLDLTLGDVLDIQTERYGSKECLVIPWTGARWSYHNLHHQSNLLARALVASGIRSGDRVGIMAGNSEQYVAVFFACMRIGVILVILNNTYTATEAKYALKFTECRMLFTTMKINHLDNRKLLSELATQSENFPALEEIVILRGDAGRFTPYSEFTQLGEESPLEPVYEMSRNVNPHDICNLQFTSGTTGNPKAASLTHHNLVNNSRFIGDRMALTEVDVLCCPPPLFHCFGLVLGLLAVLTHGGKVVYPTEAFDAAACLKAISDEKCTALHGVPAMFDSIFSLPRPENFDCSQLRTGIIAGAPVPRYLMELLVDDLGMTEFTSSYGLTEASPTCFNAFVDDTIERRLTTVGTLMPHAHAKIIDHEGNIVPVGARGELCIAGYQLQAGYWRNDEKTAEAMVRDEDGVLWLKTGDEAVFHEDGYCTITGRFKDIIIRGGENIYPLEIEERLAAHSAIDRAIVVGLKHHRYGEVVAAFLQRASDHPQILSDEAVRGWVRERLGRHKAPAHIFWLGDEPGVPASVPLTGSGKVKKYEMARLGESLLAARKSKL